MEEVIGCEMWMDVDGDDDELDTMAIRDVVGKRLREEDEEGELVNVFMLVVKVNWW